MNKLSLKDDLMDENTVSGSRFQLPLMEFSGACSGCGETPYVKLLTHMFGDRMVVANSSGCSSVWGGSYGLSHVTTNAKGQGPAWARSLFEDESKQDFIEHLWQALLHGEADVFMARRKLPQLPPEWRTKFSALQHRQHFQTSRGNHIVCVYLSDFFHVSRTLFCLV